MWSVILFCTAGSSLIAFVCYVIALHKEYKAQEKEIVQLKETIKQLQGEIKHKELIIEVLRRLVKNTR